MSTSTLAIMVVVASLLAVVFAICFVDTEPDETDEASGS